MIFKEIREQFDNGMIDKNQYQTKMFEFYRQLFCYKEFCRHTMIINSIHINKDEVVVTLENQAANGDMYTIDMTIDERDWRAVPIMAMNFGSYEVEELKAVNQICQWISEKYKRSLMIDVGANLGWYTINVCKQYSNIVSYAFEPVNETFQRLKTNVEINNLSNCRLFDFGLSNVSRSDTIFYNPEESGAASLANIRDGKDVQNVCCRFVRLDEFALNHDLDSLQFVKCDVEGAELLVYQGGFETIKKFRPVVFSEMLRKWAAKFNYHPNQIIELFESIGYDCYVIEQGQLKKFHRVNDATIQTNYFFFDPHKHEGLINNLAE